MYTKDCASFMALEKNIKSAYMAKLTTMPVVRAWGPAPDFKAVDISLVALAKKMGPKRLDTLDKPTKTQVMMARNRFARTTFHSPVEGQK
mmetsp:Transcript_117072/g.303630  ORF Transcript_117072/g.303630 Transcript_117072/m.303630 type:complete len:90 (+) Transcript_117072:1999-2268(+)